MTNAGVYVHVPFCSSKCKYCSFASSVQNGDVKKKYFQKLNQEILATPANKHVKTIFFGGGTPSAVNENMLCQTLEIIKIHFNVLDNAEITLEANPNSVDKYKLKKYKQAGFNRISYGVQSFEDETLKLLGRTHLASDVFCAVEMAKSVGFDNISIDLIIGARPLNKEVFEKSILKMKTLGITHISVYILMLEVGTRLFEEVKCGKLTPLGEEEITKEYRYVQNTLENIGFCQYEISNFALKGKVCQHNQNYWDCGEYYGFGLSSHSYLDEIRAENVSSLDDYLRFPIQNLVAFKENLGKNEKITEKIMLSLRTVKGLNLQELENMGHDILKEKESIIKALEENNMIKVENGFLKIEKDKFVVSNQIILELI